MPIIKSAKKAIRGSFRKKAFNDRQKHAMKEIIKKTANPLIRSTKRDRGDDFSGVVSVTFIAILY